MREMSIPRGKEEAARLIRFVSGIFLIVLLDQITKFLALAFLASGESTALIPGFFHLTLVKNTGIAFGFFDRHEALLKVVITLSIFVLALVGYRLYRREDASPHPAGFRRAVKAAFVLILGGAVGNWLDRIRYGAVIDFLDFRIWPVFNLADTAITIGVFLYLLDFLGNRKARPS